MRELRHGMRVRLRTRPANDWSARGTIVDVCPGRGTAFALMDDHCCETWAGDWLYWHEGEVEAPLGDWVILKDQEPDPDHAAAMPTYH
jgi:hypothetical protein